MPSRRMRTRGFAVCIHNAGFGASLEVRKLYPVVADRDAEANDLIRVIDESGEDYVYRLSSRAIPETDVTKRTAAGLALGVVIERGLRVLLQPTVKGRP